MGADRCGRGGGPARALARMAGGVLGILAAAALPAAACEVRTLTNRTAEVACSAPDGRSASRARIEVRFGGFHDDSRVSMVLDAGGEPVACHPEDRTSLSGEDGDEGDVTLGCRFDPAPVTRGAGRVTVRIELHHAEFAGAVWVTDAASAR